METLKLEKIAKWCNGEVGDKNLLRRDCCGVSTDTRSIKKGEVFVAVRGENHDGHSFIREALNKGAVAAIAEKGRVAGNKKLILVSSPVRALGDIAAGYKKMLRLYAVGVTGSDGKTTTKELIRKTLSARYRTAGSEGNFNNAIGLPLSILNIDRTRDFCVLEMGMNRKGEIGYLSRIAQPEAAVITNVGTAHIGYLNSMQAIAEAKSEIIANLEGEKLCIFNYDSKFYTFFKKKAPARVISFGRKRGADTRGIILKEDNESFSFAVEGETTSFNMNFWNPAFIYPALIASVFCKKFSIGSGKLKGILGDMKPLRGRGMIHKAGGCSIIDETYNCNPNSLKWALYTFSRKDFKRKVAVLGDMEELGRLSFVLHRNIGLFLRNLDIDILITFGEKSKALSESAGANCRHFREPENLNRHLAKIIKRGDALLIKGSRAMQMEKTVEYLIKRREP